MKEGKRVLIVEDEVLLAYGAKLSLEEHGFHVVDIALSAEDAFRAAHKATPDLVLMDITLSGDMDGIDAVHTLRAICSAPVVFMTGNMDKATIEKALKVKPAGFIQKPFEEGSLIKALENVI